MDDRTKYILTGIFIGIFIGMAIFYLLIIFRIIRPFGFGVLRNFSGNFSRQGNFTNFPRPSIGG